MLKYVVIIVLVVAAIGAYFYLAIPKVPQLSTGDTSIQYLRYRPDLDWKTLCEDCRTNNESCYSSEIEGKYTITKPEPQFGYFGIRGSPYCKIYLNEIDQNIDRYERPSWGENPFINLGKEINILEDTHFKICCCTDYLDPHFVCDFAVIESPC